MSDLYIALVCYYYNNITKITYVKSQLAQKKEKRHVFLRRQCQCNMRERKAQCPSASLKIWVGLD